MDSSSEMSLRGLKSIRKKWKKDKTVSLDVKRKLDQKIKEIQQTHIIIAEKKTTTKVMKFLKNSLLGITGKKK